MTSDLQSGLDYYTVHDGRPPLDLMYELLAARVDARDDRAMIGYFIGFEPTGVDVVDRVLATVASAGKAYHSTEFWADEAERFERDNDGASHYVREGWSWNDLIQFAGNLAAVRIAELEAELKLVAQGWDNAMNVVRRHYGDEAIDALFSDADRSD